MVANLDENNSLTLSNYAKKLKENGFNIISWSLERSAPLRNGGGWYYMGLDEWIYGDGNILEFVDFLASEVGIIGLFSDWPATATFYANCKDTAKER